LRTCTRTERTAGVGSRTRRSTGRSGRSSISCRERGVGVIVGVAVGVLVMVGVGVLVGVGVGVRVGVAVGVGVRDGVALGVAVGRASSGVSVHVAVACGVGERSSPAVGVGVGRHPVSGSGGQPSPGLQEAQLPTASHDSTKHPGEQPSQPDWLPSSHSSGYSALPSPHVGHGTKHSVARCSLQSTLGSRSGTGSTPPTRTCGGRIAGNSMRTLPSAPPAVVR
jgi:hypothetical protein